MTPALSVFSLGKCGFECQKSKIASEMDLLSTDGDVWERAGSGLPFDCWLCLIAASGVLKKHSFVKSFLNGRLGRLRINRPTGSSRGYSDVFCKRSGDARFRVDIRRSQLQPATIQAAGGEGWPQQQLQLRFKFNASN